MKKGGSPSLGRLDGLDGRLVMVLVNLAVNGRRHLLVLLGVDVLLGHGAADILLDIRLVLARVGQDLGDGLLGFLHDERLIEYV